MHCNYVAAKDVSTFHDLVVLHLNDSMISLPISQVLGVDDWENIANNLPGNTRDYTVDDLRPLTWYQFRVTAVNTAGPSVYPFRVSTVAFSGSGIVSLLGFYRIQ